MLAVTENESSDSLERWLATPPRAEHAEEFAWVADWVLESLRSRVVRNVGIPVVKVEWRGDEVILHLANGTTVHELFGPTRS
jgi:hypothetical protein